MNRLGRRRAGERDQLGLGGTVEDALSGGVGGVLAGQGRIEFVLSTKRTALDIAAMGRAIGHTGSH
jgi:hypothetical protein